MGELEVKGKGDLGTQEFGARIGKDDIRDQLIG